MQVETFEQTEVVGGKLEDENSPEAMSLIVDLGLNGQVQMTSKTDEAVTVRCPYRVMTKKEGRVYECLFPLRIRVEDYKESMIPLRVLQVIAHAKSLNIYREIQVWCEQGRPTDPVLVGVFHTGPYAHSTVDHILARWGDALDSFEVLYEKAKKILSEDFRIRMIDVKSRADGVLSSLESNASKHLSGEWVNLPS